MKEINVKLNGYICASHNLKLDVRIILSYNFTVIKKSTHRSMPTHILRFIPANMPQKKPPKHTQKTFYDTFFKSYKNITKSTYSWQNITGT